METNKFLESNTTIILITTIVLFLYINNKKQHIDNSDNLAKLEYDKKYDELLTEMHQKTILLKSVLEKQKLLENKLDTINNTPTQITNQNPNSTSQLQINPNDDNKSIDPVLDRDRRVISDPLYPIINRTDRPTFDYLIRNPSIRGVMTRYNDHLDTPRPIAIAKLITNDINNVSSYYYLFGKRKSRNSSKGEYYLWAPNIDNQIKIPLVDDRNNPLIQDFDNLPSSIQINNGIFAGSKVFIQELQNADLISPFL